MAVINLAARQFRSPSLFELVNAIDLFQRIRSCPLDLPEHGECLCPLHRRMDEALAEVERALSATTLDEVIREPSASVPLCSGRD